MLTVLSMLVDTIPSMTSMMIYGKEHTKSSTDDFAENLPFEEEALMRIASGGDITINLSDTQIEVIA